MKIQGRMIQGFYFLFLLIIMTGCAGQKQENMEHVSETSVPTYARETKTMGLPEKANPYMIYFDEGEFLFFSMEETQVGEDGAETQVDQDGEKTQADQDGEKTQADQDGEKTQADQDGEKTQADRDGEEM